MQSKRGNRSEILQNAIESSVGDARGRIFASANRNGDEISLAIESTEL